MRRTPVILALLLSLGGCDGHLVTLNIKEQKAAHEKAHRRTLYSCNEPNTVELVRAVARSLGLVEQSTSVSRNKYNWQSSDGRFMLFLENQEGELWRVELVDWPEPSRSKLSTQAEAEIRKGVKASCFSS